MTNEYIEIDTEIGDLFKRFEEAKNIKFANTDEYIIEQEDIFQVKNEHNEWIDVTGLVTKEDTVTELEFNDLDSQKYADKHLLSYDKLHTKYVDEFKKGDVILDSDGKEHMITNIKKINKSTKLYDLQVLSDTHLYQTSNKLIHHNSIGLVNLAWNYIQMKRDVVYISLELKEEKIMKRYITHSTKIPTYKIPESEVEIYNHLRKCNDKGYGRFTVHFYQPNSLTSMKLELFIRNYVQKYDVVPIIILDYAGLMIPNGKGWQGMFERDKYVSEELRGVATTFDTIVWTADQYNRCIAFGEQVETPNGMKNIEDVVVGDLVLGTNNEFRTVLAVTEPEEQEVYEITLKSGKTLKVSSRHIFPKVLENGKQVEDCINSGLSIGDKLIIKD